MDQKKKFCRKKRSIANSMLSLILVFAMVISNVQTSSGMLSTVWAAESEAQTPDGEAETGGMDEDIDSEETGEVQKSLDSEETNNEERSETTAESTQTGESERSEETSEGGNTETTTSSAVETETASETETTTESETETVTQTETETETTEEESDAFLVDGDENPVEGQVNIVLHFRNSLGWNTVAASYAKHNGESWGDGFTGEWPGVEVSRDQDGYFTIEQQIPKDSGFAVIFNNNNNGEQTADIIIPSESFESDTYERWIWIEKKGGETQHIISTTPVSSPEIKSDNKVTFRYKNDSAQTVLVAGSMNNWIDKADNENCWKMEKDEQTGIFSYTTESALTPDVYSYKFVVDGGWVRDPNNESFTLDTDQNSILTIEGDNPNKIISPEVNGNKVTFRYENSEVDDVYVRGTMNGWVDNETYKMTKDETTGIHTLEVEMSHGSYEYKFHYEDGTKDGVWLPDPNGQQVEGTKPDRNSIVYVPGTEEYTYTIHYFNPGADIPTQVPSEGSGPDLHIWDMCPGAAEGQEYAFEALTEDEDKDKGKTWLTATVKVPFPHINIIARPTGGWVEGVKEKEWTYELKKDAKTAELWFVYGEGLYDNNPFLETYKYTIHYYNPATPNQESSTPDLYIWGADTANPGKLYSYAEEKLNDTDNGIQWMTTEVDTPYEKIGLIGKTATGDNEAGR